MAAPAEGFARDDLARRITGRIVGVAIVVGAIVLGVWTWRELYRFPRTDDAYVRANTIGIAPHVGGPIVELHVVDNQRVAQGDEVFIFASENEGWEVRGLPPGTYRATVGDTPRFIIVPEGGFAYLY